MLARGSRLLNPSLLQWPLLLAFVLVAFNILYLYAPNVKHQRWHWLMPGTIGAMIVLLLWLYLSGSAILIGVEVNSEIEKVSVKKP